MNKISLAVTVSALVHLIIGVVVWLDIDFGEKEPLIKHGAVSVTVVQSLPEKPKPKPEPKPAPKPEPEPEPKPAPKPEPKPAPKPEPKPKPKPAPKPVPKPAPKPAPKVEPKPVPKVEPKPAPKPVSEPQIVPKPAPKPKTVEAPTVAPTHVVRAPSPKRNESESDTQSLLNSLIEDAPKPEPKPIKTAETSEEDSNKETADMLDSLIEEDETAEETNPEVVEGLTMDDFNALRTQLAQCWNIPTGAVAAEDLLIKVRVLANPDASIKSASLIEDSGQSNQTYYTIAAESALRALRDPKCTPLQLPLNKYEQWQDMILIFDPKEMF